MRASVRLTAILAAVVFAHSSALAQDKPRIIAVNYPLQYFAERLVDDAAEVIYPVPADVDPSFWRPSIADISAIQSADLILLNGAGFATWTSKVSLPRSKLVDTSRRIEDRFIATESITHSHGEGGEHSHEGTAPYTWLDPDLAVAQAEAVAEAIKTQSLGDEAEIDERLATLTADLTSLDRAARETLEGLTDAVIVATHPRYQYFARAYGLTILSLEWEAGAAPTDDQLAELRALVDDNGATVLIWEAETSQEARDAIADLGLQDAVFPPLAVPPSDVDFIGNFKAAVDAIAVAAARAGSG